MKSTKLDINEAAALLGLTTRSVQRLINLGKLPTEKVPRGTSGWKYQVPLSALPSDAQANIAGESIENVRCFTKRATGC